MYEDLRLEDSKSIFIFLSGSIDISKSVVCIVIFYVNNKYLNMYN